MARVASSRLSQSMPRAARKPLRRPTASSIVAPTAIEHSEVLLMVADVAADVGAVAGQHLELAGELVEAGGEVGHLGVLGHEPQRLLLALAADHDRRPAGRDRAPGC